MDRALTRRERVLRALRIRVHAALLVTAFLFSINYIVSKIAMREIAPFAFAWLRVAGAFLLLSAMTGRQRRRRVFSAHELGLCAAYGVLGVVVNQLMFLGGLARTTAHEAAILITTIPVFVLVTAVALRRERLTGWKIGGVVLALLGAFVILARSTGSAASGSVAGNAMIVTNCLSYALYLVLSRPLFQQLGATLALRAMFGFGTLFILPFSLPALLRTDWSAVPWMAWGYLVVVIVGPTVGAYVLNGWALARAESSTVAIYTYLQPVIATLLAAALLGESVSGIVLAGGALIIAGVAAGTRATVAN